MNNFKQNLRFGILTWKPKEHFRYKLYTFLCKLNFGRKWKRYWFTKRCNFIHKPLFDALKNTKYTPIDYDGIKKVSDFEWEVITPS